MTLVNKYSAAIFALMLGVVITPNTVHAGDIHIKKSGFSVSYSDRHYYKKRHRNKHYNNYYYNKKNNYYNNRYYNKRNSKRYYYNKGYDEGYYDGSSSYKSRKQYYRNQKYRNKRLSYCPTAGYSRYAYRNRECYRHKDHFHCD